MKCFSKRVLFVLLAFNLSGDMSAWEAIGAYLVSDPPPPTPLTHFL